MSPQPLRLNPNPCCLTPARQDCQQSHSVLQEVLLCFFNHTCLKHLQNSADVWREEVIFQVQLSTLPFSSGLWPPSLLTLCQPHELGRVLLVSLIPAASLCPNKIHVFSLLSILQVSVMSPERKQQSICPPLHDVLPPPSRDLSLSSFISSLVPLKYAYTWFLKSNLLVVLNEHQSSINYSIISRSRSLISFKIFYFIIFMISNI